MSEVAHDFTEAEVIELFGDKEVRWYQAAIRGGVEETMEEWADRLLKEILARAPRILVVAPTGSGKTVTSGLIFSSPRVRKALGLKDNETLKILFIAHTHRLLSQAEKAYADAMNVELITQSAMSEVPLEVVNQCHVACIDEAHHEAMMSIQYRLDMIGHLPIIGLTATPDRADGCVIKFDHIIEPLSRQQAVEEGWLAETDLLSFVDTPSKSKTPILTDILTNFHMEMGQAMVFVRTKVEVAAINRVMLSLGRKSVALLGQKDKEVDSILDQFSEGKIDTIINCKKINEGVDVRGCTDVVLGRQFGSYPQLNQVIGRASRPDSDCRVWELINPLSGRNLDTTVVVGTPRSHRLYSKRCGVWETRQFDYTARYVDELSVAA